MASSLTIIAASDVLPDGGPPEAGGVSYSKASYYTILGLYLLSFPGLWSTVKRSTKAKVKRKTFVTKGEKASAGPGKSLREEAGGIMACKLSSSKPFLLTSNFTLPRHVGLTMFHSNDSLPQT